MGCIPPNVEDEWTVLSYTRSGARLTKLIHPSAWKVCSPTFAKKNPKDSLFGGYAAFLEGLGWVLVEKVMTRQ